jgi:hypothetical protein
MPTQRYINYIYYETTNDINKTSALPQTIGGKKGKFRQTWRYKYLYIFPDSTLLYHIVEVLHDLSVIRE